MAAGQPQVRRPPRRRTRDMARSARSGGLGRSGEHERRQTVIRRHSPYLDYIGQCLPATRPCGIRPCRSSIDDVGSTDQGGLVTAPGGQVGQSLRRALVAGVGPSRQHGLVPSVGVSSISNGPSLNHFSRRPTCLTRGRRSEGARGVRVAGVVMWTYAVLFRTPPSTRGSAWLLQKPVRPPFDQPGSRHSEIDQCCRAAFTAQP